jgi:hypothetical protein
MKILFAAILALTLPAVAVTHQVTLTWTAPADATSASTVTVFRYTGACTGTPAFTSIATGVAMTTSSTSTTGTYIDTTVTVGTYCYTVQQDLNGAASVNSNLAPVTVSPLPPTGLTLVAQ